MNKNEPVFPIIGEKVSTRYGLTKLEYFSIKCLQGILSKQFDEEGEDCKNTVSDAIEYAKELLKQLEDEN